MGVLDETANVFAWQMKNSLIAMIFNNSWGDISGSTLEINNVKLLLDDLNVQRLLI